MNVLEAIKNRRSVREYSAEPIPDDVMQRVKQALRFAPSACNFQPWRFIFVEREDLRGEIARIANNQLWIAQAPVIVVGCGSPDGAYTFMGGHGNSAEIDVAIALDHLTLAAAAEGLGTCWIGAFQEGGVKELLRVPYYVKVVAMTPLGYPATDHLIHPLHDEDRKPPNDVFSSDYYDNPMG